MLNFLRAAPTTYDNDPVCQLLRVLNFFCSSPPTVHFFPASFDPLAACLSSLKMRRFKSREQQERHFAHVCVWSDFNVTPVKSPEEIDGSMSAPPLPSSVSASFNELFKPSINRRVLMHFTSVMRPMVFFHMCRNYGGGEGKSRYDMKAKVQLLPSPSPSTGASRRGISGRSRGVEKVSPSHFDVGARCW